MSLAPALAEPVFRNQTRNEAADLYRGLGLWIIFIDHINHNVLANVTPWRLGFSDFAEIFVFLSGLIGIASYEKAWAAGDLARVYRTLARRMRRLYVAHVASLAVGLGLLAVCASGGLRIEPSEYYLWMGNPGKYLAGALALAYAPGIFKLLPLYLYLSLVMPLAAWGLRRSAAVTLLASGAIWMLTQFVPGLDVPAMTPTWRFDPFAWQFLLVLGGAAGHFSKRLERVARLRWVAASAGAIVVVSLAVKALVLFPGELAKVPGGIRDMLAINSGKPQLAPYRLVHFAALVVLGDLLMSGLKRGLGARMTRLAMCCGRDSLVIYAVSLVLDIAANLILATRGRVPMQVALSLGGVTILCWLAWWRDRDSRVQMRNRME